MDTCMVVIAHFFAGFLAATNTTSHVADIRDPRDLLQFVLADPNAGEQNSSGGGGFVCGLCLKFRHIWRNNVRTHIESIHYKGHFIYHCDTCGDAKKSKQDVYSCKSEHKRQLKLARWTIFHSIFFLSSPLILLISLQLSKSVINSIFFLQTKLLDDI